MDRRKLPPDIFKPQYKRKKTICLIINKILKYLSNYKFIFLKYFTLLDSNMTMSNKLIYGFMILGEVVMIILFSQFTTYSAGKEEGEQVSKYYPFFQDVNVMVFVGFGFLMTFLKNYSWSSVGVNFLLSAWTFQFSILTMGFWKAVIEGHWDERIHLDIKMIIDADFAAASTLISFGAVLGKLNFAQYFIMSTVQTIFYGLSFVVTFKSFFANDIGGSMSIHVFGAYFGLAVAMITYNKDASDHHKNGPSYMSNIFAMIGTLFLWMFWPSFNVALADQDFKTRGIINTILSLCGSCVITYFLTLYLKNGKFHMEYILNATLAGGVIIGSVADVIVQPWLAIFIGCVGGVVSTLGLHYLLHYLQKKIKLQDTCGVHFLHGIPGILGGLISVVICGTATEERYGSGMAVLFPKIADLSRTNASQGWYQFATLGMVLGLSITSGILAGLIINLKMFQGMNTLFEDEDMWHLPEDEASIILKQVQKIQIELKDHNIPREKPYNQLSTLMPYQNTQITEENLPSDRKHLNLEILTK
jgi:ammonium transporter Rh